MKRILIICLSAAVLASCTGPEAEGHRRSAGDIPIAQAMPLAKSRLLEEIYVGGFAGFAICPTSFLKLSVVLIEGGDRDLFDSFVGSTNPTVQAMGLVCLSQTDNKAFEAAWGRLKNDPHELKVCTGGLCGVEEMTLGEFANRLRKDRNYLGHADDYWDFQKFRQRVRKGKVPVDVVDPFGQTDGAASGSQPLRQVTNQTSAAAGSDR
jgi:hypothetical protein